MRLIKTNQETQPLLQKGMNNTDVIFSTLPPSHAHALSADVGLVYGLIATIVFVVVICILLLQFMIFVFRQ